MRRPRICLALLVAACLVSPGAGAHEKEVEGEAEGGVEVGAGIPCQGGSAGSFSCWNVDLLARLPTGFFGRGMANDIWGWTDPRSGREYALIGLRGGTAFVDVSAPHEPVYVGVLPTQTVGSTWRDIKTYADHAFVVSEAGGHGLQIFDLGQLAAVADPPALFAPSARYTGFGNAHNLALDEATGMAFALGTRTCAGGLHMVDVTRPRDPRFAGCFGADGYTHDAQCVIYHGPDAEHHEREICFNSNENTLTIVDVTSRDSPRMLSRTGYAGRRYTHQGWLTGDQGYFLLDDELDERAFRHDTRTYVWDVSDLEAPFVVGTYTGPSAAIDHNQFVVGNHVFQANYLSGLRVLRIGDLARAELVEVGFFDTFPDDDRAAFSGAWGVYPFFASGVVVLSDINRGLFVLRPHLDAVPECSDGIDNDRDGRTDHPDDPSCEEPSGAAELPRSDVAIDVKPWSAGNVVNPRARNLWVAVLGSPSFEVGAVDPETLRLGPGGAPTRRPAPLRRDVNADGWSDLLARYSLREARLPRGDVELCLRWSTWDGTPYAGCDAIHAVPASDERPWRR